jgi:predicted DsbA family dithiol-disulfide isomerase
MTQPALTIDVVSDVVCPWCYLGKRRLEQALALMPDRDTTVRWRPFRLDPTIPPEGIDREDYLTRKFGSLEAVADSHQRLTEIGQAEGITYRFDAITRAPNTVNAHRLARWASAENRQDAMVERLFAAYFSEGLDVGDNAVVAPRRTATRSSPRSTAPTVSVSLAYPASFSTSATG